MCECCEHHKPILENENSVLFICDGCLILQDKTKPSFASGEIKQLVATICYESKWIKVKSCPVCGKELK